MNFCVTIVGAVCTQLFSAEVKFQFFIKPSELKEHIGRASWARLAVPELVCALLSTLKDEDVSDSFSVGSGAVRIMACVALLNRAICLRYTISSNGVWLVLQSCNRICPTPFFSYDLCHSWLVISINLYNPWWLCVFSSLYSSAVNVLLL